MTPPIALTISGVPPNVSPWLHPSTRISPSEITITPQRIAVIGQGYVGLPLARAAHTAGHNVIGFEIDEAKVDTIARDVSPIDDVTDADLARMHNGFYTCTDDPGALAGSDVFVVTVPTPLRDGAPDLTAVISAAHLIGPHLQQGVLVILESTVAPGTTNGVFTEALSRTAPAGVGFLVAFSPERIDPGNREWTFETTPKLVGGTIPSATRAAADFYRGICDRVVEVSSPEVAESAKLLENTYRHVNIALVNELARHLRALDIDAGEVIAAAATKPYGFQAFYPGPGVGGHCLPIDPAYLSDAVERLTGNPFRFVDLAMQINAAQPAYVVQRVTELLNDAHMSVRGSTIVVLGATYKRDSGDLRESPALPIIRRLAKLGARIWVCDPHADPQTLAQFAKDSTDQYPIDTVEVDDLPDDLPDCDLALVLTDHTEFSYAMVGELAPRVLDTRGGRSRYAHPSKITTL